MRNVRAIPKYLHVALLEAALDQPNPTRELKALVNKCCVASNHPHRDRREATLTKPKRMILNANR